ncbi:uncharacterized protein LOC107489275 [Arachis duranensis]|uniref:Uncharacterized protein LOC107489275 n=1 Tax=Arachis duranensis TaxID=130453 RepID=A0A6P5NUA4_ARADU|nr:uncharacterized protein LOC107489275 [Arachis duranensis]
MLARKWDEQGYEARTKGKEKQEFLKRETEENATRRLSKEAQKAEHKGECQKAEPRENIYYVELASDEDEEKETEAQTDWETRLAKKLELNLKLKRKRETKHIPMLTYRERQEEQEDREPKKTKNSTNSNGCFVYGNPVFQKRRKLWRELTISNRNREEPQAVLGDFNDILSQDEKKVGTHGTTTQEITLSLGKGGSLCLNFRNTAERSDKKEFRFEAFWTEHEECEEVIRRTWQQDDGNRNYWNQFIRKRSRCIRELKEWSRRKFKRADKEIEKKKNELHQIQKGDMTDRDQIREKELKNQITDLWKQEEKYWGQRSRLKWLNWGDKNTAFFHATTIQRRMRNRIDKLKDEAGHWTQGEADIMRLVETHFTKLFTSEGDRNMEDCIKHIPTRVTRKMNDDLMAKIKDEEIKDAVFSMGSLKAPGPDGLNGLFFQQHWDILSKKVCGVVRQIFEEGSLPEDLGETTVVLIPKVRQPDSLNQLRPIICCVQEEEIYQLIQIINKYTEASGQRINTEKFGLIFGIQVSIQRRVNIKEITGMASWEEPGKYLGLPATWSRSKNKALEWIEEKIIDKMQGWKEKLLNQAGKEVLITAVIQVIPVYAMNIIKFLKYFCKKIESTIAKFWWTNNGKERSIHWKSWTKMTKSKLNGGLGFKDFESQNIALLAKQAWRLVKEEGAIWARILKGIYYPNCSFWEAGRGGNASWIWRSMLEGRDFLKRKGRWNCRK